MAPPRSPTYFGTLSFGRRKTCTRRYSYRNRSTKVEQDALGIPGLYFFESSRITRRTHRAKINATMLAQSKTIHQAEIDAAREFIDFLRFNVAYMQEIYVQQPASDSSVWNRLTYRPLKVLFMQ